jgi:hypothetical protein
MNFFQKNPILTGAFLLLSAGMGLSSCYYDNEELLYGKGSPCDTTTAQFSQKISAILQSNCTACHNQGNASGSVKLDDYASVKACVDGGRFLGAVRQSQGYVAMPPSGKLSNCDLLLLEKWVREGAQNN